MYRGGERSEAISPVFFGEYERTVDYKGRLTLPSHLLTAADGIDWSRVMVLKADPPCLYVYDVTTWKAVLSEAYGTMDDDELRLFMHRALSDAQLSEVDTMKRITIPATLLEHAQIEKRSIIVGMANRLEIWDPEVWKTYLDTMEEVQIPSISDLSRSLIHRVS